MNTRAGGIARTISSNPATNSMLQIMAREGKTSGTGYKVEHVQPGAGFSATEYSSKNLGNGRIVQLTTYYPGPFDGAAGLSTEITERYSVFVGWEEYNAEYERLFDTPPLFLPSGAIGWSDAAFDGPRNWYADFDDAELAEEFAASLPPVGEDHVFLPLSRSLA